MSHTPIEPVMTSRDIAPPEGLETKAALDEISGHLGAAIAQSIPSDDQIIMEHVRQAYKIARTTSAKEHP